MTFACFSVERLSALCVPTHFKPMTNNQMAKNNIFTNNFNHKHSPGEPWFCKNLKTKERNLFIVNKNLCVRIWCSLCDCVCLFWYYHVHVYQTLNCSHELPNYMWHSNADVTVRYWNIQNVTFQSICYIINLSTFLVLINCCNSLCPITVVTK